MDAERFDAVAKAFGAAADRRRLTRAVAGAVLGGLPGLLGSAPAGAASDARCPADKPFVNNRVCDQPATLCPGPSGTTCRCFLTANGTRQCLDTTRVGGCPRRDECDRNRDCGPGKVCAKVGGCCPDTPRFNQCLFKCPKPA